jgi:D-threonate/D-erythronate kinase
LDQRWLIIADDLTGAADSAIAFAKRRLPARVSWGEPRAEERADALALAFDADTRRLSAPDAARRHQDALRRLFDAHMHVFKKIDSTLRGHPAEEIGALLDLLAARVSRLRAVFTPAFPAGGRVTRGGRVFVHGVPLERTEFWDAARPEAHADLVTLLESAGLHARHVALDEVRGDSARLRAIFDDAQGSATLSVCDAESDDDLDRIAAASLVDDRATFFAGSAGFAHALARRVSRGPARRIAPIAHPQSLRGALFIVGSQARASRVALAPLARMRGVQRFSVDAARLVAEPEDAALPLDAIARELEDGVDVVIDIRAPADASVPKSPEIVEALARRVAPLAVRSSALMATGGDSAAALLARCGVRGIQLADELEPGSSLGLTLGDLSLPVVTKSGGFGDEGSLRRIVERLRFIRQTGTVA